MLEGIVLNCIYIKNVEISRSENLRYLKRAYIYELCQTNDEKSVAVFHIWQAVNDRSWQSIIASNLHAMPRHPSFISLSLSMKISFYFPFYIYAIVYRKYCIFFTFRKNITFIIIKKTLFDILVKNEVLNILYLYFFLLYFFIIYL